mmetsp:Transcript_32452/g.48982  ORF Transcript_32452/g.48982 Transcript_32452/m.48982 type:complete len:112 (+) Transcript_32452:1895-2230(+)
MVLPRLYWYFQLELEVLSKIIGGSGGRNPKTVEVEDDPSSDCGEGNGKTVQRGCGGVSLLVIEQVVSHQSRSITIAQTAPTTQKRRTIYFLQRYRRKESMDMKSNGLMVQQ